MAPKLSCEIADELERRSPWCCARQGEFVPSPVLHQAKRTPAFTVAIAALRDPPAVVPLDDIPVSAATDANTPRRKFRTMVRVVNLTV